MGIAENLPLVILLLSALLPSLTNARFFYDGDVSASAGLSSRWTTYDSSYLNRTVLAGQLYWCGFFCSHSCPDSYFAIYMRPEENGFLYSVGQVVWTANRNIAVKVNSTLELTSDGDLVLKDADGGIAWSSNTSGKSVVGMKLTEAGNLLLFDHNNDTVWQSFDHPTDVLLPGQKFRDGQKLIPSIDDSNFSASSFLSLSLISGTLTARVVETDPPQVYYREYFTTIRKVLYIELLNGSFGAAGPTDIYRFGFFPPMSSIQFAKFSSDGHLRVYGWQNNEWEVILGYFTDKTTACRYPSICGVYGICSNAQCTCPASTDHQGRPYFKAVNDRQPNLGCTEVTPLSCETPEYHSFLELKGVTYFDNYPDLPYVSSEKCKESCLSNCSCKAVFFTSYDSQYGKCTFHNQIFSLTDAGINFYTAYIKVQNASSSKIEAYQPVGVANLKRKANQLPVILASGLSFLVLLTGALVLFVRMRRGADESAEGEDYLDAVPGMPTRFSYNHLQALTENFSKKLGEGGFGSVFEGTFTDGTKVAVKHLYHLGHTKDSFLAEVTAVASIRHVNLVTLLGFCAEKSQRLLVYEYVANGSLDRWIFRKDGGFVLEWPMRKKIILDIARGLNYLHECSQKIIHLDIKPQNILLDENFNAKVCDFGLSKLIERDQSRVMTTMRGTPGYLAPEWLNAAINEKVDVYSFGVVILEMVCGRRVLGNFSEGEDRYLLNLFKRKADEGCLLDIVDECCNDVPQHGIEAVAMMKLAAWCLQNDYEKRPSMSMVVKVLEGVLDAEEDLDYSFWKQSAGVGDMLDVPDPSGAPLLPSILSGPR